MNHQYKCLTCGTQFESPKKNKKYCSHKCYAERYGNVTKVCIVCHTPFTVPYRFRGKQTCSPACHSRNMSTKLTTREIKQCLHCGSDFEVVQSYKEHGKYCSLDCFYRHHYGKESDTVVLKCEGCGQEFERPFAGRKAKFCSKSCAISGERNGMCLHPELSPWKGKQAWNHGKTAKDDPRLAAMGEKISEIIADKMVNGEWNHQPGYKGEHFFSKKNNKEFYLRSSYESKYARMLEQDDDVVSYEHEPFRIPYLLDGSMHNYVPDFFVTRTQGKKQLIEVKPSMFVGGVNAVKFQAARQWCQLNGVDYCIVTEAEIESGIVIHQGVI